MSSFRPVLRRRAMFASVLPLLLVARPLSTRAEDPDSPVWVNRGFLEGFEENLVTAADAAALALQLRDLKPDDHATARELDYFASIQPAQDWLSARKLGAYDDARFNALRDLIGAIGALNDDLKRPAADPMTVLLTSQTLEALDKMALSWFTNAAVLERYKAGTGVTAFGRILGGGAPDLMAAAGALAGGTSWRDPDVLAKLAHGLTDGTLTAIDVFKIGGTIGKRIGVAGLGADDLVTGAIAVGAGKSWRDPLVAEAFLGGINRSAWGAVGFLLSDGNAEVAAWYANAADLVAKTACGATASLFADAYMHLGGFDQKIMDLYVAAQRAATAHGKAAQSFEAWAGGSADILAAVSEAQRRGLDRRVGVTPPEMVSTHVWHENYNEACRAGVCTRTPLPDPPIGGVRIDVHPKPVGVPPADLGARVLGNCRIAPGAACAIH